MDMTDYTLFVCGLLDITPLQLGTFLLCAATIAPVISTLRPPVERTLKRWAVAAALTRTTADDTAVRVLAALWAFVVWIPATALKAVPVFTAAVEAAREQRKGPAKRAGGPLLGLLTWAVIAIGALSVTGCARGSAHTTPLHRATAAASVFTDAGVFAGEELERHIEGDLVDVRVQCLADRDTRDCDAEVRFRAREYEVVVAGHALYARVVGELVAELEAQARRRAAGDDVDLGDAIRLAGRVLTVYRQLSDTFRIVGVPMPPVPATAIAALEDLR